MNVFTCGETMSQNILKLASSKNIFSNIVFFKNIIFNLFFIRIFRIIRRTFHVVSNMSNYFFLNIFTPLKRLEDNSFHLS